MLEIFCLQRFLKICGIKEVRPVVLSTVYSKINTGEFWTSSPTVNKAKLELNYGRSMKTKNVLPLHATTLLQKLTVTQLVTNSPHFMQLHVAYSPIQFFKIHLDITLPSRPRSSKSLFPSHILTKPCVFLSLPLKYFTWPNPPHLHMITPVILGEEDTQYAVLFSFLKLPLSPIFLPQQPILKHPQPMFFPKYDQSCFTPVYNMHSTFRNDIPLWYMMIIHNDTYICLFLAARFDCCEKQTIILQCCIENIIMYCLIPLQKFSTKAKTGSRQ